MRGERLSSPWRTRSRRRCSPEVGKGFWAAPGPFLCCARSSTSGACGAVLCVGVRTELRRETPGGLRPPYASVVGSRPSGIIQIVNFVGHAGLPDLGDTSSCAALLTFRRRRCALEALRGQLPLMLAERDASCGTAESLATPSAPLGPGSGSRPAPLSPALLLFGPAPRWCRWIASGGRGETLSCAPSSWFRGGVLPFVGESLAGRCAPDCTSSAAQGDGRVARVSWPCRPRRVLRQEAA
mmetsp:Transcript_29295/g.64372  ORF Transcript_29295/g.64372 Transcript_29295/m.64372 type:complete len:240 (+) Transcript_29295:86-805(+)